MRDTWVPGELYLQVVEVGEAGEQRRLLVCQQQPHRGHPGHPGVAMAVEVAMAPYLGKVTGMSERPMSPTSHEAEDTWAVGELKGHQARWTS